ncbi:hypothetical protein, partial [Escherichia coli]|uniref:hypothetical protein n=1 Tax=Escherichia coli TaxID=562 RepID=UPI001BB47DE0
LKGYFPEKSGHNAKAYGEALSLRRLVVRFLRTCASGCGNPRNGAAVSMAGLFLPQLRTPGCQVDHTLK